MEASNEDFLNNRLNILWVVDHMGFGDVLHGAGNYYINMIPEFDSSNFRIILCVLRGKQYLYKSLEDKGFKVYYLNKGKTDFTTIFPLLKIIKNEKINLLHLSGYGSANFGRIASIITGLPNIVHAYDEDMNYPFIQALSDRLLSKCTSQVIAVSEAVKLSCVNKRSFNEKKVKVLYTGIPSERFESTDPEIISKIKQKYNLKPEIPVVGTLSRLREEKGVKYFIEAAALVLKKIPDVYFFVAGDGPQAELLKNRIKELNIQNNVILAGFCDNPKEILSIFDIFVLSSLMEGFSASIQEAMAQKKPIVATNVGGTPEMLEEGVTGFLVPPKNPDALSEKIVYLLKDKNRQEKIGNKAHDTCCKWKLNVLVKDLENLYLDLIK